MKNPQKGFTLLLAALVASIVLSLGASIYTIASKSLILSSIGRDSQFAFYAADTGSECALFWDLRFGYFATTAPASVVAPDPQCAATTLSASGRSTTYPYTMTFQFEPNGFCSIVNVTKDQVNVNGNLIITTLIHSDGYNTNCTIKADAARSLQRSVELHY